MSDINKEKYLDNYPIPVTIDCTNKILEQMKRCICKINNKKGKGTGFFCHILYNNKNIRVLITNNHIIDEEIIKENDELLVALNDEKEKIKIKINDNRKIYTNSKEKYDITIIEIKEKDNIKNFIDLDNIILDENPNIFNENIYLLQYPKYYVKQLASVSYGILKEIKDEYNIIHLCSTDSGSSGSPIIKISNNKVIGIHIGSLKYNYNSGTFLKYPINEYLNNINLKKK